MSRPTRVAHIVTRFLHGGGEHVVAEIINALPAPGYAHVVVVGRDHAPDRIRELCGGVDVRVVPSLVRDPSPRLDAAALRHLDRILRETRPDIVHTIQSKSGILGRAAARRSGVPARVHSLIMANFGPGFGRGGSLVFRSLEHVAAGWTDEYVVVGEDLRRRYETAGILRGRRHRIVRTALDLAGFRAVADADRAALRNRLGLAPDLPTVAMIGSLDARKGILLVPALVRALLAEFGPAQLVLAGEGPLRGWLEREAESGGLPITVLGFTRDVPAVLGASDCLLMLSSAEGIASALVEAAAARRPFVSTDVDGPRELLAMGATGAVVPQDDVPAAARALAATLRAATPCPPLDLAEWGPDRVRAEYRAVFEAWSAGARAN